MICPRSLYRDYRRCSGTLSALKRLRKCVPLVHARRQENLLKTAVGPLALPGREKDFSEARPLRAMVGESEERLKLASAIQGNA